MSKFKFELKAAVVVSVSGETGIIKGRSESIEFKNQYNVHYKAGDGRAVDRWFFESELKLKPKPPAVRKAPAKKKRAAKRPIAPTVPAIK